MRDDGGFPLRFVLAGHIDALLNVCFDLGSFRTGQEIARLLAREDRAAGVREDRQERYVCLRVANWIPGNPDAVGCPELRGAEVLFNLLGGEGESLGWRLAGVLFARVVKGVDDEAPVHRHRFFLGIVEIDPSAKPARGDLSQLVVHGRRPDHGHLHRLLVERLFFLRVADPGERIGQRRQR